MTSEQRKLILEDRKRKHQPWHSPPHREVEGNQYYLVTAACYEHRHIIGQTDERMTECEEGLVKTCADFGADIYAWCLLPNHYHILLRTLRIWLEYPLYDYGKKWDIF